MGFVVEDVAKKIVTIKGKDYELVQPLVEHAEQIEKLITGEGKSSFQQIKDACLFLELLGLPLDVSKGLTLTSITKLIQFVNGEIDENGQAVNAKKK